MASPNCFVQYMSYWRITSRPQHLMHENYNSSQNIARRVSSDYYSQTGCSFDGNFANSRRNIGIWLTVWVEQVTIAFAQFSYTIWRAVCESNFLLWLMIANIHYNRTTALEKREKIIALCGRLVQNRHKSQKKLDYRLKRYPTLWTNSFIAGHISLESLVGRNEQFLPLTLLNL